MYKLPRGKKTRKKKQNATDATTWFDKGIEFGERGDYEDAIECYEKALNVNPNFSEVWNNKGIALGQLGRHEEAIKCFDKALQLDSTLAEAYGNKGIVLINMRKYTDATNELKAARDLFSEKGTKKEADKAQEYEILAKNAFELILVLSPLDEKFLRSLNSESLTELKEKTMGIATTLEEIIKEFEKKKLSEDVIHLLQTKTFCFTALSNALSYEKVDINKLAYAEALFEEWGFKESAIAVASLNVFIQVISKYSSLKDVSKNVETYLLELIRITHVLNGKLTEEISEVIRDAPTVVKTPEPEAKVSKKPKTRKRKSRSRTRKRR